MNAPPPPPPTMSEVVRTTTPIKQGQTLADLYRKAKAKGVLTSFSQYPLV
jgi:hypothetical protein